MAKGIIVRKGTGGGKLFAAIAVTYPEGSTCVCKKGSKTLSANGNGRQWIFSIHEEGEWTVTSTDKADQKKTKSQTVYIADEGQTETVILTYEYVLFDSGSKVEWDSIVQCSGYDNVSISNKITCGRVSGVSLSNTGALAYTKAKIPLKGYSALKVHFTSLSGLSAHIGLADMSSPSNKVTYSTWAASRACSVSDFGSGGVAEVPIGALNGQSLAVVLGFSAIVNETGSSCDVDRVWLE